MRDYRQFFDAQGQPLYAALSASQITYPCCLSMRRFNKRAAYTFLF